MKKGVVILGCLVLGLAFCVPAVAQTSLKAVETIIIDDFDTPDGKDWKWSSQASRYVAENYPVVKTFDGIPNSLKYIHSDIENPKVMGCKVAFNRKGDNWVEIYPGNEDGSVHEVEFKGTVEVIDFWVWGAGYSYRLEVLLRDADGRVHVLDAGHLNFSGWKNCVLNVPTYIKQHSELRSGRPNLSFVGFRVRSDATAPVDDYVIYFDKLEYTSYVLSNIYDGYDLKALDFEESGE